MVQGPESNGMYCWNDNEGGFGGFPGSDEFQNPLFDYFDSNNNVLCGFQSSEAVLIGSDKQVVEVDAFEETGSLGLTLSKTPSFLNLVEMAISQGSNTNRPTETNSDHNGRANVDDFVVQPKSGKLKASNFPALLLRIGSWERVSRNKGELVAKCHYARKKLIWEVLEGDLKSRIEINWSDISAIRATIHENEAGILEIELNQPPRFSREETPNQTLSASKKKKRKQSGWNQVPDFTEGQAPIFRRHYVKFPPGTLDKYYHNLLQSDYHLFMLSQRPFPSLESPYFHSNFFFTESSFDFNGHSLEMAPPPLQFLPTPLVRCHQFQNFEPTTKPSFGIKDSISPMSDECVSNHGVESPMTAFWPGQEMNNIVNNLARQDQVQVLPSTASANQVHPDFSSQDHHLLIHGEGERRPHSNNEKISDIENHLLSDSEVVCSVDKKTLLTRVNSMFSLLDQSEVVSVENNTGIKHMDSRQDRIIVDPLVPSITENFNGNNGLLHQQPITWMPQVSNENLVMHLSSNNSSFPVAFPNPMMEDFTSVDNVNHWT